MGHPRAKRNKIMYRNNIVPIRPSDVKNSVCLFTFVLVYKVLLGTISDSL